MLLSKNERKANKALNETKMSSISEKYAFVKGDTDVNVISAVNHIIKRMV